MKRRIARHVAKVVAAGKTPARYLTAESRQEHDAQTVLVALHAWIRNRKYAPTVRELAATRGYREAAVRKVLEDLEPAVLVVRVVNSRWVLSPAGAAAINRDHVVPVLPADLGARKRLAHQIRRLSDDDAEVRQLQSALGAATPRQLYRTLFPVRSQA